MAGTSDSAGMATESPGETEGFEFDEDPDSEAEWLNQEALKAQAETEESVLPVTGARVRYRIMKPEKFASLVDHYRITELARDLGDLPEQADLQDADDLDLDDVGVDELEELDDKFRVMLFYRDVIVPQIERPEQVHWADPDHMMDPAWVDISDLPDEDKIHLVACVTGQDPEGLMDSARDRIESFPG